MQFNLKMSACLDANQVKAAIAEMCRKKIEEQYPGLIPSGAFSVTAAYGFIPDVNVEYLPNEGSEFEADIPPQAIAPPNAA